MILLFILILSSSGIICRGFTPKDHYLLSCGTFSDVSSIDGRAWSPDENTTFAPLSTFSSTTVSASPKHDPSAPQGSPYSSARIFNSTFTYTFPVSPGPKFLRLYFLPAVYSPQYDASRFFTTVLADERVLLRNFSAQLAVNYAKFTVWHNQTLNPYVVKEYYLTVPPNGRTSLNLTISPTTPSSHAFLNGIELVSVPDNLYVTNVSAVNVKDLSNPYLIPASTAFETMYRLNVGGTNINPDAEASGMYRIWKADDPYTFMDYGQSGETGFPIRYTMGVPNYTAPEKVYQTFKQLPFENNTNVNSNLTWRFKVDPGFSYIVRLHWCEVDENVTSTGDRVFAVYINGMTAESDMDVFFLAGEKKNVPYYRDYFLFVKEGDGGGSSADVWIALHPNTTSLSIDTRYREVLLNGLEMFKMNKVEDGSLAGPNPHVPLDSPPSKQAPVTDPANKSHNIFLAILVGVVASLLIASLACLIFRRLKKKKESSTQERSTTSKSTWFIPSFQLGSKTTASERSSTLPSHLCRRFSLKEIRWATQDFSEGLIIGHGGFGNVYKGMVDGEKGFFAVAIKRLNASSKQGVHEFTTEIEMLSKLRHVHLVSLIGFCDESGEMILVYEYMDNGTLRDHLYNTNNPPLSWKQRLNACLGAAKGLHYLHSGASQMIIHRDVKSTNILLDEKWVSKVSDFGLSKLGPMGGELTHVSTAVKGSIGYLDLEYYKTQRLTEKSDVYSFGVVLFEVLCGRAAVDPNLSKEQVNLAKWARGHNRNGTLEMIVDPNIKDEIAPACLNKFGEIAESCVRDHGTDRPSMADLVWSLEFSLDLQQRADDSKPNCNSINVLPSAKIDTSDNGFQLSSTSAERVTRTNSSSALILSESGDFGESIATSISVFSEIHKPDGR